MDIYNNNHFMLLLLSIDPGVTRGVSERYQPRVTTDVDNNTALHSKY